MFVSMLTLSLLASPQTSQATELRVAQEKQQPVSDPQDNSSSSTIKSATKDNDSTVLNGASNETTSPTEVDSQPADETTGTLPEDADLENANSAFEQIQELDAEMQVSQNASRIFNNFIVLMQNSWVDVAFSVWDLIKSVALNTLLYTIAGFTLSVLSFLLVRKLGWTKFRWEYYWAVSWILPLLFVVCMTFGFGYAGFFRGASNYCNRMIKEEHIIERSTLTMYCTLMMDAADYEATGEESVSELLDVMNQPKDYHLEFDDKLKDQLQEQLQQEEHGWFETFVIENTVYLVDGKLEDLSSEHGLDLRVLVVVFLDRESAEAEFGEEKVKSIVAATGPLFEKGRKYASAYVTAPFEIQYYLGMIVGILIPCGCLGTIHLTILLVGWIANRTTPATSESDKNDDSRQRRAISTGLRQSASRQRRHRALRANEGR